MTVNHTLLRPRFSAHSSDAPLASNDIAPQTPEDAVSSHTDPIPVQTLVDEFVEDEFINSIHAKFQPFLDQLLPEHARGLPLYNACLLYTSDAADE